MGHQEANLQFSTTSSQLTIYPQIITPKLAEQLLLTNHKKNRRIKPQVVESYRRQMEKGLWRTNTGEGIKISESNLLINGQHRLKAIIAYGKPVEMLIFAGIPEESMTCIDDGIKRSLTDAMMINGKTLPNQLAINSALSCLVTLYNCVETDRHYSAVTGARRNSTSEMIQFFDALPNFAETAAEFFTKFKYTKIGRIMPQGLSLAMYYLLNDLDDELMFSIFKSYETGIPMDDLRDESPIYHACERARRARELKIRVMAWDHISTFLWVYEACKHKKKAKGLPRIPWDFSGSNDTLKHARKKLMAIKL